MLSRYLENKKMYALKRFGKRPRKMTHEQNRDLQNTGPEEIWKET